MGLARGDTHWCAQPDCEVTGYDNVGQPIGQSSPKRNDRVDEEVESMCMMNTIDLTVVVIGRSESWFGIKVVILPWCLSIF